MSGMWINLNTHAHAHRHQCALRIPRRANVLFFLHLVYYNSFLFIASLVTHKMDEARAFWTLFTIATQHPYSHYDLLREWRNSRVPVPLPLPTRDLFGILLHSPITTCFTHRCQENFTLAAWDAYMFLGSKAVREYIPTLLIESFHGNLRSHFLTVLFLHAKFHTHNFAHVDICILHLLL